MQVHAGLTGPFPRSEALVRATRDLDRGRTGAAEVEALFARTESEVVDLELRLGLDQVSGGYLRWADLFRPFAESWGGFTVGPLTRWYETNTFYRQPILHAPPERAAGRIAQALPPTARSRAGERAKVILPGPYTFARRLDNRSGETDQALVHRLGRLLADEVGELRRAGYRLFQFQEPELVVRPPEGPAAEAVLAGYRAIAQAATDAAVVGVWTFFADAGAAWPLLSRLPVQAVGVDLAETDAESLTPPENHAAIGLGIIDPRTTLVEDPAEVARLVRRLDDRLRPPSVWIGPGAPLDLLPWESAQRKLQVLPQARAALGAGEAA